MSARIRQKSCTLCAESKRRCDRQLPKCQRCLDRDEDCVYPLRNRRRRRHGARESRIEEIPEMDNPTTVDLLGDEFRFEDWRDMSQIETDVPPFDEMMPYIQASRLPPDFASNYSAPEGTLANRDIAQVPNLWFLQEDTWDLQHLNERPGFVTTMEQDTFIAAVDEMLSAWVTERYNGFIHRRLYEKGLPGCLQDAFTTLSAYKARTPAVKDIILQIAEDRSLALTRHPAPVTTDSQGILAHLSRVQALFIYEFIRLFDGSVRLRVSAEKQLPTLQFWTTQMWKATETYQRENAFLDSIPQQLATSDSEREYNASSTLWRLWILTESVRRTHVLINTIANIYQTMTTGVSECTGVGMITARNVLWDAESGARWFKLSCEKSPLMIPVLYSERLISTCMASEVDEFVKLLWLFLVDKERIRYWIDSDDRASGRL